MSKQIWKDVVGYEGYYQISNDGRVKSLHGKKEKELKLTLTKGGYLRVELNVQGSARKYSVHRLVAEAFISRIKGKLHVNHINNIRTDNRVENLEWCTPQENIVHAAKQGRLRDGTGSKNTMAILTEEQVLEIRRLASTKQHKQREIGAMFGLDEKHISLIVLKKRWKHI